MHATWITFITVESIKVLSALTSSVSKIRVGTHVLRATARLTGRARTHTDTEHLLYTCTRMLSSAPYPDSEMSGREVFRGVLPRCTVWPWPSDSRPGSSACGLVPLVACHLGARAAATPRRVASRAPHTAAVRASQCFRSSQAPLRVHQAASSSCRGSATPRSGTPRPAPRLQAPRARA